MLIVSKYQNVRFKLLFAADGEVYDPTLQDPVQDVIVSIVRGNALAGSVISTPISYLNSHATPDPETYIEKNENSEFIFHYKVSGHLFPGNYTVIAKTVKDGLTLTIEVGFQVKDSKYELSPTSPTTNKSSSITYRPSYRDLDSSNTSSVLLLGHANNMVLNDPIKIKSIQNAIDLIGADTKSPLLRGVLDAYDAGAKDIFICAVAPMSEYVSDIDQRNVPYSYFNINSATPSYKTFYEKYHERLEVAYSIISQMDFIDIVVPLEVSMIKTGSVDFITQLANYCETFHNNTGFVQIGIIGSRTNGVSAGDIDLIKLNSNLVNKYTTYNYLNQITGDKGRYVIPIYGEATFSHTFLNTTYVGSVAAAYAGMLASADLNIGIVRKRIPGAMALYGVDLTNSQINELEEIGINTIYRGKRARRGNSFEVYISNDYTLSNLNSVFSKSPQLRLAAYVASEVRAYADDAVGSMGYDIVSDNISKMLRNLKKKGIVADFEFKIMPSLVTKGSIIVEISVISTLGLRKIDLALAAGPGA
jgi:hypothetical protein